MKKRGFRDYFDMVFNREAFYLLVVTNTVCLLLLYALGWPHPYTGPKPREHQLNFERRNDQVIDEFVRPKIEGKYNVKTLRSKTSDRGVNVRIETDGTGRYEEIAEDVLRLAPGILGYGDVAWSRAPDIGDKGMPKSPQPGWNTMQLKYILEFDHGSNDGGVTVFFANGMRYPGPTSSDPVSPRRQEKSPQWHSNDYYNFH